MDFFKGLLSIYFSNTFVKENVEPKNHVYSSFLLKKNLWFFIIGLQQKNPLKRSMILELKKKDGLAKQMLQTAKLSDFCPVYKAFPSVVRVIAVSTV